MKKILSGVLILGSIFTALAETNAPVVYVIPIRGAIEPALLYVVRRGVAEAERLGAKAIVFPMDTPGGTLDAATEISRHVRPISVPTYTLVEKQALSAGALIALATKHIYMTPGSVMGDALPIMMSPLGGVQEMPSGIEEKAVSAVTALARASAEYNGHDPLLAEKMVRREMEYKVGDVIIGAKGQLLTLTAEEAARPLGAGGKPLLSEGTVKDLEGLLAAVGLRDARVEEINVTRAEHVARFIAMLSPLLLMAGLFGVYMEFKTPGFGLPGILGLVSLGLFFWGHHIAGLAGWEDVLIFTAGVALLLIELLVIPGFGVTGVLGIIFILWGLLSAMIQRYPGDSWWPAWSQAEAPLLKLGLGLGGTVALALILAKYLPQIPVLHGLMQNEAVSREAGYDASRRATVPLGALGVAESALKPGGVATFTEGRFDVVTGGEYIEKGASLRVVDTHGNRIVVAKNS